MERVAWPDYHVDPAAAPCCAAAVARLWAGLEAERLAPDYAGVRAKLPGRGKPAGDFAISGPAEHKLAGLVNLFEVESPGLTASLALGDHVVGLVQEAGG